MKGQGLNGVKARLGSISPARMNEMTKSVQHLLEVDMPRLIEIAHAAIDLEQADHGQIGLGKCDCSQHRIVREAIALLEAED